MSRGVASSWSFHHLLLSIFSLFLSPIGNAHSLGPRNDEIAARPDLTVPTLTTVRGILSNLEAPIISTLVQRSALTTNPSLYQPSESSPLLHYIHTQELEAQKLHRFDYGRLEYPFTLPLISPDHASRANPFPPGRFHQDTFSRNANLTAFYTTTLVPLLASITTSTPFFYHLSNSTQNDVAALTLDAQLLALMSHRAHIGKIVAESKFAANVSGYTPLIYRRDASAIRTLLTNVTQEESVLTKAQAASRALASAWVSAGALVPSSFVASVQGAAVKVFRELIDITTQIEVEYLLQRLD
ncbi:putative chorismate mutase [Hypsizygus marmoreus]|uniref:chorismate mutase n=1 Tax=Hypsizygus marmoreus TaxID=39966 RepID=A0A369J1H8_HYPMA|nr:putative chorismate mutase [Hypsizygus marmoreus]